MIFNILLYSFIAGLSTILGVYLVRRFETWTKKNSLFLISFAIGVILANAFFHLLPESIKLNQNCLYFTLLGIFSLYIFEHFITIHACSEEKCEVHTLGLTSALGIGFHSLIDGIIIAIGFKADFALGILTSLAVIFHELPEGVFTYTLLIHDQVPQIKSLIYSWLVALATPFGAILTYFLIRNISENSLGIPLAFAGGTFIYIGSSDLIPETHRKSNIINVFLVGLGILFVIFLGRFLER